MEVQEVPGVVTERVRVDMTKGETFWVIVFTFAMGGLCGWACFGQPRLIEAAMGTGNLAEWVAGVGTWIIGYGAWKYARATHFHTLDRADDDKIGSLRNEIVELLMFRDLVIKTSDGKSAAMALERVEPLYVGAVRLSIMAAVENCKTIAWPDAKPLAFSTIATKKFVELRIVTQTFVRIAETVAKLFEEGSLAPLSANHQHFLQEFSDSAMRVATTGDELLDLLRAEVSVVQSKIETLETRRGGRKHVFDFTT